MDFRRFLKNKPVIGMIHLLPLPGSPGFEGDIRKIEERAMEDLNALTEGGADSFIIENFGDIPYDKELPLEAYSVMLSIAEKVKGRTELPFGINIQFNCTDQEWAMAYALNADFLRAETFVESRAGTHGISLPSAPGLLRKKKSFPSDCLIFADINVKHTYPLTAMSYEDAAHEAIESFADAIIISGKVTGQNPDIKEVQDIRRHVGDFPIFIGSGVNKDNIRDFLDIADGVIVGSCIKRDGIVTNEVDVNRVKELINAAKGI